MCCFNLCRLICVVFLLPHSHHTHCMHISYIICSNFSLLSRHGWCGTTLKLVTGEESAGLEDQEISHTGGWGVCGQTCDTRHRMVRGGHNEDLSDICAYTN